MLYKNRLSIIWPCKKKQTRKNKTQWKDSGMSLFCRDFAIGALIYAVVVSKYGQYKLFLLLLENPILRG